MSKKTNGSRIYSSYMFKDKDPVIDQLRTLIEKHYGHRVEGKDLSNIAESGGPTSGTMRAWFFGATRRPQSPTIEAAGRAIGFHRVWQPLRKGK